MSRSEQEPVRKMQKWDENVMKTTVIIPNYNGGHLLGNCLHSLFAQTAAFSVLVVDNASADDSLQALAEFPQVRLIRLPENKGFSAAVNVGIREAKTPYVLLLNNDTEAAPGFVEELEQELERHPKAFAVSAQMRSLHQRDVMDSAGDYYCALGWAYGYGKGHPVGGYEKPRRIFSACAGAALYRREVFDRIGLFDELHFAYLEDIDIGYRAAIFGYSSWYAPKAVVYHAGSAVSGSRYNAFKVNLSSRNSIYLIEKNMPFLQILLNLPFLLPGFLIKYVFFVRKGLGRNYRSGFAAGFRLYFREGGRKHHVAFRLSNLGHYLQIQLALWGNLFRRIRA